MKEKWRLLKMDYNDAYTNMAIDRAIMEASIKNKIPPTVRFYRWHPPALSIGYFQSLEDEVDLKKCKEYNIDYVRRITGGGAVFHENEVTYSIVIPEEHPKIPKNIMKSYSRICGATMKGLQEIGIENKYRPINDIVVNGRKISGNAQTRKKQTVLQHGTILMDVNVEEMFSLLKIPDEKVTDKLIKNVKDSVTSIKHEKEKTISFTDAVESMIKGFEEEFNIQLVEGKLTDEEINFSKEFEKECFSQEEWNHKR